MKPLQAMVSLRAIAESIPDREVAIMCASHGGEPVHVGAVQAVLERAALGPEDLRNPPGWPLDRAAMVRAQLPHRLLHNCSGKHAGMLLACVRAGWSRETYLRPSHPYQRRVLRAVRRASGRDDVRVGVDGCGVPVHGLPLRSMATIFARLSAPERFGPLAAPASHVVSAMLAEPYLVAGRRRVDTDVMAATGDVMVKSGAEALACASILPLGLGVAVRIDDGGDRAAGPALIRALRMVGGLSTSQTRELAPHASPAVRGGGEPVGALEAVFELRFAGRRSGPPTRSGA